MKEWKNVNNDKKTQKISIEAIDKTERMPAANIMYKYKQSHRIDGENVVILWF